VPDRNRNSWMTTYRRERKETTGETTTAVPRANINKSSKYAGVVLSNLAHLLLAIHTVVFRLQAAVDLANGISRAIRFLSSSASQKRIRRRFACRTHTFDRNHSTRSTMHPDLSSPVVDVRRTDDSASIDHSLDKRE
jgi:hypothetical protein